MKVRNFLISIGTTVMLVGLLLGLSPIATNADGDDDDDPEATEIVVKLNPATASTIDDINGTFETTTIDVLVGSAGIYRLGVPTNASTDDLLEEMTEDSRLLYAEPNYSSEAPEGNPRYIGSWGGPDVASSENQYAFDMLGLTDAHTHNQGDGVTVAVLDTGVQLDHPDLANAWTTARYDFIDDDTDPTDNADGRDNDGDGFTDEAYGHGTHIAGIIHLVAPEAKIMPLRVLEADGHGNIFVIAEAIQFAIQNGANVVNLSLGSAQESELLEDVLKDAVEESDVVVVAAAGNLGNTLKQFPASEDDVLAVTAINQQSQKPDFANYGEWIDVAAPGEAILSAFPPSSQASWSGTSMAVPFVAGHAALIRSAVPSMSAIEVAGYIRASAISIDGQNPAFQGQLGRGHIDVGGSIQAICSSEDGTCQAPDLSGQLVLEVYGYIDARPANGNSGNWLISGSTYVADAETEFRLDDGPLVVGVCAEVEYQNTSPPRALKIRSREPAECMSQPQPTATPTATPVRIATNTPAPTAISTTSTASATPATTSAATNTTPIVTNETRQPIVTNETPQLTGTPKPTGTSSPTTFVSTTPTVVPAVTSESGPQPETNRRVYLPLTRS